MASRHQANFTGVRPPGQHFSIVHAVATVAWAIVWWEMLCRLVPAVDSCVTPGQSSSIWGFDDNTYKGRGWIWNQLDPGMFSYWFYPTGYTVYTGNLINFAGWLKGAVLSGIWATIPWIRLRTTSSFWTKFHFACVMSARFSFCETQKRGIHRSSSSHHSTVSRAHSLLVFMCRRHFHFFFFSMYAKCCWGSAFSGVVITTRYGVRGRSVLFLPLSSSV